MMKKYLLSVPVILVLSLLIVSCEREISFENGGTTTPIGPGGSATGTAQYTYDGGTGTCTGAIVNGTYTAGTALTATNAVIVTVNVDSIGTYSINSNTVNGISFRATGTFTATGVQTITFAGTGTPTSAGSFNFTPGTTGCSFSVTISPAANNVNGNFKAKIDGTQWVADKFAQCAKMNGIINISGLGLDKKTITITLKDSGVHQYTLAWDNTSNSAGAFMDSALADVTAFTSNAGLSPSEGGGTVNITSIDEVNKKMSGTFSFKAKRSIDNTYRTISEGVFTDIPYITNLSPINSTDSFSVKIDGTDFPPTLIVGIKNTVGLSNIAISGSDASGTKSVGIYFPIDVTPGVYTIAGAFTDYFGQYNVNSTTFLSSTTGTLEILFHDPATKRVRGRFSFAAEPFPLGGTPVQLTEGYFAVTYL